jgi:SAM-dependent methyltransferase
VQAYYAQRAREYEAIYSKPERQAELAQLRAWLTDRTVNRTILELACGTGYWTAVCAPHAASIDAFDLNEVTLAVARQKQLPPHVHFAGGDAYAPIHGHYDCGMAHFWWSHVPLEQLGGFLKNMADALQPGARCLFIDNAYAHGSSTPLSRTDDAGNTYQLRTLADGSVHEVLKKFPSRSALQADLQPLFCDVNIIEMQYYWTVEATLK